MTTHDRDDAAAALWARTTLIYVAPRTGESGVSDYADDLIGAARERVGHLVEVRHGGAGTDGFRDVRRARREIRDAMAAAPGPVIVHAEQSGGVVVPFWVLADRGIRSRADVVSATLHDAPLAVWTPFRTRLVSRSRLATHGIHYPLMWLHRRIERTVLRGASLFALTSSGAEAIEAEMRTRNVEVSFLPTPEKPAVEAAAQRPLAVGLFGYIYRGKGFDQLAALREHVTPEIEIVVAGRGTDALDPVEGVRILGAVEGADEDRFFESIRAIVLPYGKRGAYGPQIHVASSVVARALAYRTPIIALGYPGLSDEADIVTGGVPELAARINDVVPSDASISELAARSDDLARERSIRDALKVFLDRWESELTGTRS